MYAADGYVGIQTKYKLEEAILYATNVGSAKKINLTPVAKIDHSRRLIKETKVVLYRD
jgi:hypothetical protein